MIIKFLEYKLDPQFPNWKSKEKLIINTINPHSYCIAKKDTYFRDALQNSDILIPDGIGIVYATRLLYRTSIPRIAGADMHQHLLEEAQKNNLKVFYLGSSDSTLKKIKNRIKKEYASIKIESFSPPFKSKFSDLDNDKLIEVINRFSPDILFVGMTAPKQEKWVFGNMDKIKATIIVSIGAVFDFYAGTVNRAPQWVIKIGFEWLYRLIKEPHRMWRRYLINNSLFMWYVFKERFKKK
jgi:N-acetylglucosaminyldiphosphoundecaprenol N-acetyl-beta-D-mannosaminyltransferase